jgi:hypothetical protein
MIDTLLGKVAGFFEKDFLFASFLPALIFLPLLLATFAAVLGAEALQAAWAWVDAWTGVQKIVLTASAALVIVIFAYLLQAMRGASASFWSGTTPWLWGFWRFGKEFHRYQFRKLLAKTERLSSWEEVFNFFMGEVRKRWRPEELPNDKRLEFLRLVSSFDSDMKSDEVKVELDQIIRAYETYAGDDLKDIYAQVKTKLYQEYNEVFQFFAKEVQKRWRSSTLPLSDDDCQNLLKCVANLHEKMTADEVKKELTQIISAYDTYAGDELKEVYNRVKTTLSQWHEEEAGRIQTDTAALDRQYGSLATIKATRLGNVIESYNQYSFKRYKMEAEIFWPRLRAVIKPEYFELVREPRILLDFSLTMASLSLIYALLALIAGPWLWYNYWFWALLAAAGFAVTNFFYRLSIRAANQLGEMMRACFDLFRLDLMATLERPHPETFVAEQAQWEELSKLTVYGTAPDFVIRKRKDT